MYVPDAVELKLSVEVSVLPLVNEILVGLRETVDPDGETDAVRDTLPAKLSWLVAAIVNVLVEPETTVMLVGLAEKKKSGGLGGLSRANFRIVGEDVPST